MTLRQPDADHQLFVRLRQGDEQAFVTLYRRRQAPIFRFALHMSGSATVAEDVTQEAFMALLRNECGFDPERGTVSGYLFGIARKLVLRQLERGRFDVTLEAESEEGGAPELAVIDDPLAGLTHREGIEALRRAVVTLPRRYREVVVLCDLEEVDYAEAALALGCPIGTVRSRLHRARALLLEKLNQDRGQGLPLSRLKPVRCEL
ncbi:MAG TPA: sigma-70 family RNA polymerase sigma factor [Candidatus Sulfopaludibacter sp.]|jgi:RNA polymerase sigma-70 factor (ECF subfamily)|nr:sigma-70 family RNA polymerase sigma factor [Candidatus Sulfopaludibacter sp.]